MKNFMAWFKENLAVILFLGAAFAGYTEWRIDTLNSKRVSAAVASLAVPSQEEFDALEKDVEINTGNIGHNTKEVDRINRMVERVVAVLMEE